MLNLEGFMNIRDLKQEGWSVSAIAEQLNQPRPQDRPQASAGRAARLQTGEPAPCKIESRHLAD
jgi:hypothetical protein